MNVLIIGWVDSLDFWLIYVLLVVNILVLVQFYVSLCLILETEFLSHSKGVWKCTSKLQKATYFVFVHTLTVPF